MSVTAAAISSQCFNFIYNIHQHTFSSKPHLVYCVNSASIPGKAGIRAQVNDPLLSSDENPLLVCGENGETEVVSGLNRRIPEKKKKKKRVFFLDVNPLCYNGNVPCLRSFAHWMSLFFSQVSLSDPVIAVIDGENGNEHRRQLLPSYKAHRWKPVYRSTDVEKHQNRTVGRSHRLVLDVLHNCNVPVVKVRGYEADDVIATLVRQILLKGCSAVIASPDKDFKQLLSEDVQIVMPIPEISRWSFYTIKHYAAQYKSDPHSDLSLRCIIGDEVDGVPGIQHLVPGFGRKTALKLLKKHGSLNNLLNAAAVRTVGKQYAQDALTTYADHLRRNFQVLSLDRNVDVHFEDEWMSSRDSHNDFAVLSNFNNFLSQAQNPNSQKRSLFK